MHNGQNNSEDSKRKNMINGKTVKSNDDNGLPVHKQILQNVTVEPVLFPYMIASILVILTNQNLNIQKACRVDLNLTAEVCKGLEDKDSNSTSLDDSEVAVQKLVADMLIWQTILQNSIPAVFVIFLGSWSDRNRLRRPCMLLPIYGEIVRNIGLMVCVYYFDELPMNVSGLWQALPIAVTGYWAVIFMSVFAYVGDVSTVSTRMSESLTVERKPRENVCKTPAFPRRLSYTGKIRFICAQDKNKTLRVGMINATMALCLPIGTGLSGILYRKVGFYGVYTIALILGLISIWTAHVFVHDTKRIKFESDKENERSYWTRVKFFFNVKHLVEAFRVTFKKEKNNRRMKVIALTVLITGIMGPLQGKRRAYFNVKNRGGLGSRSAVSGAT